MFYRLEVSKYSKGKKSFIERIEVGDQNATLQVDLGHNRIIELSVKEGRLVIRKTDKMLIEPRASNEIRIG